MPPAVRDPNNPICWVGYDRLLLDDVTPTGLHRKVIARKDGKPDIRAWLQATRMQCPGAEIEHWSYEKGEFTIVWLVWKDASIEKVS